MDVAWGILRQVLTQMAEEDERTVMKRICRALDELKNRTETRVERALLKDGEHGVIQLDRGSVGDLSGGGHPEGGVSNPD
jgi:hypothetical protein